MTWEKQEKRLAKSFGGTRNAGSGAFDRKGDVRAPGVLFEAKWTAKNQITIRRQVLEKIITEATAEGRVPILAIELGGVDYMLLTASDLMELRGKAGLGQEH